MLIRKIFITAVVLSVCAVSLAQNIAINTTGAAANATNMLEVTQTSAAANMVAIYAINSGATAGTGYGLYSTKTGAGTANVAGYFSATGGTANYAGIFENGNVGIGITSPIYALDVSVSAAQSTGLRVTSANTGQARIRLTNSTAGGDTWFFDSFGSGSGYPGAFAIRNTTTAAAPPIFITGTGNVGIGTTTPNQQLEITGNFRMPASTATTGIIYSGANIYLHNYGTNNFFAGVSAGNLALTGAGYNTGLGYSALVSGTSGAFNTAVGAQALYGNTNGGLNTAVGVNALFSNVSGTYATAVGCNAMLYAYNGAAVNNYNTAIGFSALQGSATAANNTGIYNTALGAQALGLCTSGGSNTASGVNALYNTTIGNYNTATGFYALFNNQGGSNATAVGYNAMLNLNGNASGAAFNNQCVAVGFKALQGSAVIANNTGNFNTAVGYQSLIAITSGSNNTASGYNTLVSNLAGGNNTAIGYGTLSNNQAGNDNTALGYQAGLGTGGVDFTQCTFVGSGSYATHACTNVTMLGYGIADAQASGATTVAYQNQVLIGNTAVTAIKGQVAWTTYSDARFKTNVKENVAGLDFIMKLKPVTYNVKPTELHKIWGTPDSLVNKIDHSGIEQMRFIGFLAQDVEKAAKESGFDFPGIDVPKNEREVYTLRYSDFIMPMVKSIQELKAENDLLKKENSDLNARLKRVEELLGTRAEK